MVHLAFHFSCTEQIVSLLEETFLPEYLTISDCLGLIIINSGCCAVSGGSKMNIVSGFCDNCKSPQSYEALRMRHENNLLCQICFQKGNSKLSILLIHICVHISPGFHLDDGCEFLEPAVVKFCVPLTVAFQFSFI